MTKLTDVDFDPLAQEFAESIYGSSKGYIRLNVLWRDLLSELPQLEKGGSEVLDVGGGMGQVAVKLAKSGNNVTLCDPSEEMLVKARATLERENLTRSVTLVHAAVQDLSEHVDKTFDVVTCHAVLEWLADPEKTLRQMLAFLKPEGFLSLMFYNRNAFVLKRVLEGKLDAVKRLETAKHVPPSPLSAEEVTEWLSEIGWRVKSKTGVRIFHDHVPEAARQPDQLDILLELEQLYAKREPFASLAQHIHLVCSR